MATDPKSNGTQQSLERLASHRIDGYQGTSLVDYRKQEHGRVCFSMDDQHGWVSAALPARSRKNVTGSREPTRREGGWRKTTTAGIFKTVFLFGRRTQIDPKPLGGDRIYNRQQTVTYTARVAEGATEPHAVRPSPDPC